MPPTSFARGRNALRTLPLSGLPETGKLEAVKATQNHCANHEGTGLRARCSSIILFEKKPDQRN